jgi:hypothetical protein
LVEFLLAKKHMTDPLENHLVDDILGISAPLESTEMPNPRALRRQARRQVARIGHQESLRDVVPNPPAAGESIHIASGSKFDFWTWAPVMLDWIGTAGTLYCSTWTLSRPNAVDMLEQWDAGRFESAAFLTGTYFKRRETAVYTLLLEGLLARGGRFVAFQNHAKVMLLDNPARGTWLTVEGSANLTANPRWEQYVITNDRTLWEFHRTWMEEMLSR